MSEKNFFDVEPRYSGYKRSRIVILRVPYERSSSYRIGTSEGPSAILEASHQVELFDVETGKEPYLNGIHTAPAISFDGKTEDPQKCIKEIEDAIGAVIKDGKFPVVIGGEHTLTLGAFRAYGRGLDKTSLISLDAHGDLRDSFCNDPFSHACVMRRISEFGDVAIIGSRSLAREEKEYAEERNIPIILARDIEDKMSRLDEILEKSKEMVYLSIDMDVFDPSVVPAVGNPEPGGLDWSEILVIIDRIVKTRKLVGFDIVELSPVEGQVASEYLAAKLIYRILAYIFD